MSRTFTQAKFFCDAEHKIAFRKPRDAKHAAAEQEHDDTGDGYRLSIYQCRHRVGGRPHWHVGHTVPRHLRRTAAPVGDAG